MVNTPEVETKFGNLEMLFVEKPFDEAKAAIEAAIGKIATAQQVAQARIVAGKDSHVSKYDSYVAENFIYNPEMPEEVLVTPYELSPILKHPVKATDAHRANAEIIISKEDLADIIKGAKEGKVYTFKNKDYYIPISKFAKDGLAKFLFKEDAQKYADFLKEAGIKKVPVRLVDDKAHIEEQKGAFARPLGFGGLDRWSDLVGGRDLDCDNVARGVREVNASEASVKFNAESILQKYGITSEKELKSALELYEQAKKIVA